MSSERVPKTASETAWAQNKYCRTAAKIIETQHFNTTVEKSYILRKDSYSGPKIPFAFTRDVIETHNTARVATIIWYSWHCRTVVLSDACNWGLARFKGVCNISHRLGMFRGKCAKRK